MNRHSTFTLWVSLFDFLLCSVLSALHGRARPRCVASATCKHRHNMSPNSLSSATCATFQQLWGAVLHGKCSNFDLTLIASNYLTHSLIPTLTLSQASLYHSPFWDFATYRRSDVGSSGPVVIIDDFLLDSLIIWLLHVWVFDSLIFWSLDCLILSISHSWQCFICFIVNVDNKNNLQPRRDDKTLDVPHVNVRTLLILIRFGGCHFNFGILDNLPNLPRIYSLSIHAEDLVTS